jgi:hypothetical protein
LQKETIPAENLEDWIDAAQKKVKRQAFIEASLGTRDFCKCWGRRREQHQDCQGKWQCKNLEPKKEERDAMDVSMVQLPGSLNANKKETMFKGVQGVPKAHVTQVEQEQGSNPLVSTK